jgi:S-adenosylmethionine-diacylgycerolhomoserine-N-methlytransferase
MHPVDRVIGDLSSLRHLLRGMPRRRSHAARLQAFYAPQAERYDAFRERLLHGREGMIQALCPAAGARVVELGAGTGRNLAFFGEALRTFASVELVDLCPALIERARARAAALPNVRVVEADASSYRPGAPADCVYFSYALTMIPDWRGALANAIRMLKPGGRLGVVDFYVSPRRAPPGAAQHSALARGLWPLWFAHDGVRLDAQHLPALRRMLPACRVAEGLASVPDLPGLRVPYYVFVGTRPPDP